MTSGWGSISILTLLDLSEVFNIIDHGIPLDQLSGLEMGGIVFQLVSLWEAAIPSTSECFNPFLIWTCSKESACSPIPWFLSWLSISQNCLQFAIFPPEICFLWLSKTFSMYQQWSSMPWPSKTLVASGIFFSILAATYF